MAKAPTRTHESLVWTVVLALPLCGVSAAEDAGELSIPSVSPLSPAQLATLRGLVQTDQEANLLAEQVKRDAQALLDSDPHPLRTIQYEGLVNTDPRRVACVERLREMTNVARILRHWQVSGDEKAAAVLRRFVAAWSATYQPTGNDVNENKLNREV